MTGSRLSHTLVTSVAAGLVLAGIVLRALPAGALAFFNWQQRLGAGLVVLGLVATAGDVGYRFGRSRGARPLG